MSNVFFIKDPTKVAELFDAAEIGKIINKDDFVALKIHFGERGNTAYCKADKTKPIIKKVRACAGKPFWVDSNTLYKGSRSNTLAHLQTAFDHGYTFGKTGAHVLIADGLAGKTYTEIKVDYKHFKTLFFGTLVDEFNAMITVSHFKGHEVTGFGGAIKNIGMGLASRAGKQQMHADIKPKVKKDLCAACGECIENCPENAIDWDAQSKAEINLSKCIGCGQCIVTCDFNAIPISWAGGSDSVSEKMAEYAGGMANKLKNKIAYVNFITDVSENCDCYDHNSSPIVPNIGILASFDPVAIDQACVDLVNQTEGRIKGLDKFKTIYPNVNWKTQLEHAQDIGLGNRNYKLVKI